MYEKAKKLKFEDCEGIFRFNDHATELFDHFGDMFKALHKMELEMPDAGIVFEEAKSKLEDVREGLEDFANLFRAENGLRRLSNGVTIMDSKENTDATGKTVI